MDVTAPGCSGQVLPVGRVRFRAAWKRCNVGLLCERPCNMNPERLSQPAEDGAESQQTISARLNRLASGRRIANLSLFSWLASGAFGIAQPPIAGLFFVCVTVASCMAVVRMTSNLSIPARYPGAFVMASLIPVLNWIPLIMLSMRASKDLRTGGFSVGFLDAQVRRSD